MWQSNIASLVVLLTCPKLTKTEEQAQFNKFVREEVCKKFGDAYLLSHEVNQLERSIMELIKSTPLA